MPSPHYVSVPKLTRNEIQHRVGAQVELQSTNLCLPSIKWTNFWPFVYLNASTEVSSITQICYIYLDLLSGPSILTLVSYSGLLSTQVHNLEQDPESIAYSGLYSGPQLGPFMYSDLCFAPLVYSGPIYSPTSVLSISPQLRIVYQILDGCNVKILMNHEYVGCTTQTLVAVVIVSLCYRRYVRAIYFTLPLAGRYKYQYVRDDCSHDPRAFGGSSMKFSQL